MLSRDTNIMAVIWMWTHYLMNMQQLTVFLLLVAFERVQQTVLVVSTPLTSLDMCL